MPLELPFTRGEFLAAVEATFELPENVLQKRSRPRASSLASCARQQAYDMTATEKDPPNEERLDLALTQEQGRMFEDITVKVIESLGFQVVDRQVSLPDDYPVSGHPDGRIIEYGLGFDAEGRTSDGLVWGFEHKHLGRYGYTQTFKQGLYAAHPDYIVQSTMYGHALGWDAALFFITSQDASSVRGDATANRRAKNPSHRWADSADWHPKVLIIPVDLRPLYHTLVPLAHMRARWLSEHTDEGNGDPTDVWREYDPTPDEKGNVAFPCSYCPWMQRCTEDSQSGQAAPQLPFTG